MGNTTGSTHFFSRQADIERNTTNAKDGAHGDPIHTPEEDHAASVFKTRQEALSSLFALTISIVAFRLIRYFV